MVLPGETAKDTRYQFANIIQRYLGGDNSLIKEIEKNATSCDSIPKLARDSLAKEGITLQDRVPRMKRDYDHEDITMDMTIKDKKQKLIHQDMDIVIEHREDIEKALELQRKIMTMCSEVACNKEILPSTKLQIQENIHNIASQSVIMGWNKPKMRMHFPCYKFDQ